MLQFRFTIENYQLFLSTYRQDAAFNYPESCFANSAMVLIFKKNYIHISLLVHLHTTK